MDIKETLGVSHEKNQITRLTSGMYVHTYGILLSCSNVALSLVNSFFTFNDATDTRITLPELTSIDVQPFYYRMQIFCCWTAVTQK